MKLIRLWVLIRFYFIDNCIIINYCIYLLCESIVFLMVGVRGCEDVIIIKINIYYLLIFYILF